MTNDIYFIRFGQHGAKGSESWMPGLKLKPYQLQKLKELIKQHDAPQRSVENLEDMF